MSCFRLWFSFLKCVLTQLTSGCWDSILLHGIFIHSFHKLLLLPFYFEKKKTLVFCLCFSFTLTLLPHSQYFRCQTPVQVVTNASDRLAIDPGSNNHPHLVSIDLLEWHTELREAMYLLEYCFRIKEYKSGLARWKRRVGRVVGKGPEAPGPLSWRVTLWAPAHVHQLGSSLTHPYRFLWRLHYTVVID